MDLVGTRLKLKFLFIKKISFNLPIKILNIYIVFYYKIETIGLANTECHVEYEILKVLSENKRTL